MLKFIIYINFLNDSLNTAEISGHRMPTCDNSLFLAEMEKTKVHFLIFPKLDAEYLMYA